mmetsp:Transcript_8997/g.15330  ORF Transcript_8997/g.15330 Transcript_8997/m.15330 type:complete len:285 (+) Transcript_8997:2646-3500(+)
MDVLGTGLELLMHTPDEAGQGHGIDQLLRLVLIAWITEETREVAVLANLHAITVGIIRGHDPHQAILGVGGAHHLHGHDLRARLLVLQIKAIRQVCSSSVGRGQAVLGQDVASFRNGSQLGVDLEGQLVEVVQLLLLSLPELLEPGASHCNAGLARKAVQLLLLQAVDPLSIDALQGLCRRLHPAAEGREALTPAGGSELPPMRKAFRQRCLAHPDVGVALAVQGSAAMLHPNASHQQQGITLLVEMDVDEGERIRAEATGDSRASLCQRGALQCQFDLTHRHI